MLSVPEFLAIGHVTRDLQADGSFSLGGTVTFAALTAFRLGLTAGIITCADAQLISEMPAYLAHIMVQAHPSTETTTFANLYQSGIRTQYMYHRAEPIEATDVPGAWLAAPIVLLGPLAQELTVEFVTLFPRRRGCIIAATPQGWLRCWDADGRVRPVPWQTAEQILPLLDALILSHDDVLPIVDGNRAEANALLLRWSQQVPLLIATDGPRGATLFQHGNREHFPAYTAREVDPTGAGDVFAAAFLVHLHRYKQPRPAVDFANCVASFAVEQRGTEGIPTLEMVTQRLRPALN